MPDSSLETASAAEGINESGKAAEALSQTTDVNTDSSPVSSPDAKPAASSTAPADKPKDMLAVVKAALDKPKADASPAPENGKPETAESDAAPDDGDEPPDLSKDERAQLSAKTTNRMRYLNFLNPRSR